MFSVRFLTSCQKPWQAPEPPLDRFRSKACATPSGLSVRRGARRGGRGSVGLRTSFPSISGRPKGAENDRSLVEPCRPAVGDGRAAVPPARFERTAIYQDGPDAQAAWWSIMKKTECRSAAPIASAIGMARRSSGATSFCRSPCRRSCEYDSDGVRQPGRWLRDSEMRKCGKFFKGVG